jgi:hypothetical protein
MGEGNQGRRYQGDRLVRRDRGAVRVEERRHNGPIALREDLKRENELLTAFSLLNECCVRWARAIDDVGARDRTYTD